MKNVWVCKQNDTVQCDESQTGISLDVMRKELALIIGEENILGQEERLYPTVKMCGIPTGQVNAYEITERGWYILNHGYIGPQGFIKCPCDSVQIAQEEVNIGVLMGMFASSNPYAIKGLIGHPLRVYKTGDAITKDYRPNRFNIEIDNGLIVNVWFG